MSPDSQTLAGHHIAQTPANSILSYTDVCCRCDCCVAQLQWLIPAAKTQRLLLLCSTTQLSQVHMPSQLVLLLLLSTLHNYDWPAVDRSCTEHMYQANCLTTQKPDHQWDQVSLIHAKPPNLTSQSLCTPLAASVIPYSRLSFGTSTDCNVYQKQQDRQSMSLCCQHVWLHAKPN